MTLEEGGGPDMSGPIEILRKACYCRKRVQQLEETIRLQERPTLLFYLCC